MSKGEKQALQLFLAGRFIDMREAAEKILEKDKSSYIASFFIAYFYRYAEGELMYGLWHLRRALLLYRQKIKLIPSRSHQVMLIDLVYLVRQLGREKEALQLITLQRSTFILW